MLCREYDVSGMKEIILCCRTLVPEMNLAMERCRVRIPMKALFENNHDQPKILRQNLQRALNEITGVERVLMGFTTCGGAMVGLKTGDFQLVIPRTDDCLSLLMGSMERRKAVLEGKFGIFLTEGWMNHERSTEKELERIESCYGKTQAEEIIQAMYGHFDSLNVIDTGAYDLAALLPRSEELARRLQLRHRVVDGTTSYLEALLTGQHDPQRFITILPHSCIREEDVLLRPQSMV